MEANSDQPFLSAVTVAENCGGIAKMRRNGSHARATSLEDWLELVLHLYADRVPPFDIAAARIAIAAIAANPRSHRAHAKPASL